MARARTLSRRPKAFGPCLGEVAQCETPARGGRSRAVQERESDHAMAGQKIRIRLKSYDHEVIDSSARKIVDTVSRAGATVVGPVPLPTEKNVFCVIRSPHKYRSEEHTSELQSRGHIGCRLLFERKN